MIQRSWVAFGVIALAVTATFVGCSDSEADDSGGGGQGGHGGDDGEHGHGDPVPECADISRVCHDVDALSEWAATCHEVGHANDAEACAAQRAGCIEHCEALAAGGGAGGAGGHGGAHDE